MGKGLRVCAVLSTALVTNGCVTTEVARFQPKAQQEALTRDGQPAIVSKKSGSMVLVRPARRQFMAGARPSYVIAIYNGKAHATEFTMEDISVEQTYEGEAVNGLKVYTYDELVKEEQARQVARVILLAAVAGAGAAVAANAGNYTSTSRVYTPNGPATVVTRGYNSAAAAAATGATVAGTAVAADRIVETGQRNLAELEKGVIKDNTLLPGEWYGGQVIFDPPQASGDTPKSYRIAVTVAGERHEIDVLQEPAKGSPSTPS